MFHRTCWTDNLMKPRSKQWSFASVSWYCGWSLFVSFSVFEPLLPSLSLLPSCILYLNICVSVYPSPIHFHNGPLCFFLWVWPAPLILRHWFMLLTFFATHLYPHTSCISWLPLCLCQYPFVAITDSVGLPLQFCVGVCLEQCYLTLWHAIKTPLKVVPVLWL